MACFKRKYLPVREIIGKFAITYYKNESYKQQKQDETISISDQPLLHLLGKGYQKWAEIIKPYVAE